MYEEENALKEYNNKRNHREIISGGTILNNKKSWKHTQKRQTKRTCIFFLQRIITRFEAWFLSFAHFFLFSALVFVWLFLFYFVCSFVHFFVFVLFRIIVCFCVYIFILHMIAIPLFFFLFVNLTRNDSDWMDESSTFSVLTFRTKQK